QYLREKSFRDTLSRFHSPEVVESLFQKGERANMEMENKVCTILFSDVKGFTALSEKLPPMDIAGLMNEYFTLMADVVFRFNGTLDKFIGDSVMAVFGAPIQRAAEDDASRAIKTAIDMQKAVIEMNKQRPEETQFHIRIGVNTGPCVAGLVGSPQRMEYTVLGDSVNTASRIESNTPPGKIYMSEETYRLVKNQFKTKELDPILAKNKTKPVKIYEILY
ncbi:MAG: adenylate/guanylate cyclase domain-containing protein, partial [Planctomycetota bacterium]